MNNRKFKSLLVTTGGLAALGVFGVTGLASTFVHAQEAPTTSPVASPATSPSPPPKQFLLLSPFMQYSVRAIAPNFPAAGTVIQPDQSVIALTIAPTVTVVTKTASVPRPGTFPQSIPAGSPMFQVRVDNGFAYCAFWSAQQGVRETQCFRDINNDGIFDSSYRTFRPLVGKSLYIGRIAMLSAIPPVPYETQTVETIPDDFTFRFLGIRGGSAEFKPQFGTNRRGFRVTRCDLSDREGCNLGGHKFFFEQTGTALTIKSITPGTGEFLLYSERDG